MKMIKKWFDRNEKLVNLIKFVIFLTIFVVTAILTVFNPLSWVCYLTAISILLFIVTFIEDDNSPLGFAIMALFIAIVVIPLKGITIEMLTFEVVTTTVISIVVMVISILLMYPPEN